ncbi:EAL domain-containing protein [Variovorax sp. J22R133]|uniref:EAL domain-containing protein n=1 Tax=Variovorax brevis TaxID=3053503 RepID=UPI002577ADF5|nr:EAL domain-containing protein [Variovorax sp. J22R133]MDM0117593.1 EAL domain-containing protein [Variovorax sp. J22R133]
MFICDGEGFFLMSSSLADQWNGVDASARMCGFETTGAVALISILNFGQLSDAYGVWFARSVSDEIKSRICDAFLSAEASELISLGHHGFLLCMRRELTAARKIEDAGHPSAQIEAFLTVLGGAPVCVQGTSVLVRLHADWLPQSGRASSDHAEADLAPCDWHAQHTRVDHFWRRRYRRDMRLAVNACAALADEGMALNWESVLDARDPETAFYFEGSLRSQAAPGERCASDSATILPCLERLGLTRVFDRLVVRKAVEFLNQHPSASAAVTLSAQSARLDHWWSSLLWMMESDASVARRLVLALSGLATLDQAAVRDFCEALQQRGCRIAICCPDMDSCEMLGAKDFLADIVKLDRRFIACARQSEAGFEDLRRALRLCDAITPFTVIDGIDAEDDLRIALRAASRWLQGSYVDGGGRTSVRPADTPGFGRRTVARLFESVWPAHPRSARCADDVARTDVGI